MRAVAAGLAAALLAAGAQPAPGATSRPVPEQPIGSSVRETFRVLNPDKTLKRLNALRRSIGSPALTEVRAWSIGCARHSAYLRRNRKLTHDEQAGRPGYTADGAAAGPASVLFMPAAEPFVQGQPLGAWANAPYHQIEVLHPLLRATGFSKGCMDVHRGIVRAPATELADEDQTTIPAPPVPPLVIAWPGEGARRVPRTINACSERPSNPFTEVGWSCGGVGAAMYVYTVDASADRCADTSEPVVATVTGPRGEVPSQVVASRAPCSWIVLTGRALPARSPVTLSVSAGGATLTRHFRTD